MTIQSGTEKKTHPLRWLLVGFIALLFVPVAQCSIASSNDPSKKPLGISDDEAAGNCIGELQLTYKAQGIHIVGKTNDFSTTSKTDLRIDLAGKVTAVDLSSGGTIKNVTCTVERGHDGSVQTSASFG